MNRMWYLILCLLVSLGLVATACGQSSQGNEAAAADPQPQSEVTCFEQMTNDQRADLIEYSNQLPASEKTNDDGTSDICVLEKQPDGNYEEHHYRREDNFNDYLLYSMLFGRSNALIGYGVISGDLDMGDALALSLLTGNDPTYGLFHPYSYSVDRGYNRQPTYLQNVTVNHIQYGSAPAMDYDGKTRPAPPSGYNKPRPVAAKTDKVATATRDANGKKSVVKEAPGVKASDVISGKAQAPARTPSSVKPSSTPTVTNPSASGNKSDGKSGGNSGGNSGDGKSPPSTSKKSPPSTTKKQQKGKK